MNVIYSKNPLKINMSRAYTWVHFRNNQPIIRDNVAAEKTKNNSR